MKHYVSQKKEKSNIMLLLEWEVLSYPCKKVRGFCLRGFCPRGFCPRGFCPPTHTNGPCVDVVLVCLSNGTFSTEIIANTV